jgi:hypothetical protein
MYTVRKFTDATNKRCVRLTTIRFILIAESNMILAELMPEILII